MLLVDLRSIKAICEAIMFGLCSQGISPKPDGKYSHTKAFTLLPAHILRDAVCHHSQEASRRHLVFRKYHLVNKFAFHMLQNYSRKCIFEWLS